MASLTPLDMRRNDTGFPPSPASLSPGDCQSSRDGQEQATLQACWEKYVAEHMGLPEGYQNVQVLIVKWDDPLDQLQVREEVDNLRRVFENDLRFEVTELQLKATKSQLQLYSEVMVWAYAHDSPDSLLIVYYAGHGIFDKETNQLEVSPTNESDDSPRRPVTWNKVEKLFMEDVDADVFIIMDCCYASDITRGTPAVIRSVELLAASHVGQTTARPGINSFTSCLTKHLRALATDSSRSFFTTRDIQELIQRDRGAEPPALWDRVPYNSRHIRLSKLKPRTARPKFQIQVARRFLHLGFELRDDALAEAHIIDLTKELPKVFKQAGVPLVNIKWLECRSRNFKDLAQWVLRNPGALSPARFEKRSAEEAGLDEDVADV